MKPRLPRRDPEGAYVRRTVARRRTGGRRCRCGERRPEALVIGSKPLICAACQRRRRGQHPEDDHHVAGIANSPLTISVPVNDHRAELTVAQQDWPKDTRENPNSSPVLAAAGMVRGFVDTAVYLFRKGVLWVAELLEALDTYLRQHLGPGWWHNTPLARFAPTQ